jgi:protein TonB
LYASQREKAASALAACAVVLMLAYVLVVGLRVAWTPRANEVLVSLNLEPPPLREKQRPKQPVRKAWSSAPKGSPSPPNLRNQATQVVAPPKQLVILPAPIVVATQAGLGNATQTGAADRPGPGQGAGGIGNDNGGGGNGGRGEGGDAVVGPQQIKGRLRFSDIPEELLGAGEFASVGVRYTVGVDGRVSNCRIDRSSRKPGIDALACRMIERRFRFRPARDEDGRPVRSTVVETHSWSVAPEDEDRN